MPSAATAFCRVDVRPPSDWPCCCLCGVTMCGRRNFASAMAILGGTLVACGGPPEADRGSGPDASAPDASAEGGLAVGCATPSSCGQSGSSDAGAADGTTGAGEAAASPEAGMGSLLDASGAEGGAEGSLADGCSPPQSCGEASASDAPAADSAAGMGDSGADGSTSCLGSVTFHVVPGAMAFYCRLDGCGAPGGDDVVQVVTVLDAAGQPLAIAPFEPVRYSSFYSCSTCQPLCALQGCTCDGGLVALPAGGIDRTWDGRVWSPGGTCPLGGMDHACDVPVCAPAGQYTAHVCATAAPFDSGVGLPTQCGWSPTVCVDIPFTYPAQSPVVATLP